MLGTTGPSGPVVLVPGPGPTPEACLTGSGVVDTALQGGLNPNARTGVPPRGRARNQGLIGGETDDKDNTQTT